MEEAFEALPSAAAGANPAAPFAQPTHTVPAKQARHGGCAHAATAAAETVEVQMAAEGPPPARRGDCMVFVSAPRPSALLQLVCILASELADHGSCTYLLASVCTGSGASGTAALQEGLGSVLLCSGLCCSCRYTADE